MQLVSDKNQIIDNIILLEKYLKSNDINEKEFAENLIRRGRTIIIYKVDNENHFAPSRFVGYANNEMSKHISNDEKDGKETNPVITKIIGRAFQNEKIENKFIDYCNQLGIDHPNNKRSFWRIKNSDGDNLNLDSTFI
jgi:hypothetical protein